MHLTHRQRTYWGRVAKVVFCCLGISLLWALDHREEMQEHEQFCKAVEEGIAMDFSGECPSYTPSECKAAGGEHAAVNVITSWDGENWYTNVFTKCFLDETLIPPSPVHSYRGEDIPLEGVGNEPF